VLNVAIGSGLLLAINNNLALDDASGRDSVLRTDGDGGLLSIRSDDTGSTDLEDGGNTVVERETNSVILLDVGGEDNATILILEASFVSKGLVRVAALGQTNTAREALVAESSGNGLTLGVVGSGESDGLSDVLNRSLRGDGLARGALHDGLDDEARVKSIELGGTLELLVGLNIRGDLTEGLVVVLEADLTVVSVGSGLDSLAGDLDTLGRGLDGNGVVEVISFPLLVQEIYRLQDESERTSTWLS